MGIKNMNGKQTKFLFYEYERLKEEYAIKPTDELLERLTGLKSLIVENNLSLCIAFARTYCRKYNKFDDIEDIKGECVLALSSAVDAFDCSRGCEFSTLAYKYMDIHLYRCYTKEHRDALKHIDFSLDSEMDEDNAGVGPIEQLYNEEDILFHEDIDRQVMIDDIYTFLRNYPNEKYKNLFVLYYGLEGNRRHTEKELAISLQLSPTTVAKAIKRVLNDLYEMFGDRYPLSFADVFDGLSKRKQMREGFSKEEAHKYVVDSYYGLGLERKNTRELAEELNLSTHTISEILRANNEYNGRGNSFVDYEQTEEERIKSRSKTIFNMYYGKEGYRVSDVTDIQKEVDLKSKNRVTYLLKEYIDKLLNSGEITAEELEYLNQQRDSILTRQKIDEYMYYYLSYYGMCGYEKKSQFALSKELRISPAGVAYRIRLVETYLAGLSEAAREAVIEENLEMRKMK